MRVLYLTNAAHIGGGNRSLQTLWEAEHPFGIRPTAVCPNDGPMVRLCSQMGIPISVLPYQQPSWQNPVDTFRGYWKWRQLLKQCRPDIIHANDFSNARSVALAAWFVNVPVVCHIHFHQPDYAIRWVVRRLPKPAAFIHNSDATRRICGPVLDEVCPRSQQVTIHNCVPVNRFQSCRRPLSDSRPTRVGIVGNLIPIKGHEDFLSMAGLITRRGIEAEYWIIGEDVHQTGYRWRLEEMSARLGLEKHVQFLGFRADVCELLKQLDVLVVASHVEPFGIVSVEGMACELPVVGTRVGGIPEAIEDGVTGFLVAPRSPAELAEKVTLLLTDAELRRSMGTRGRARAKSLFSVEKHVDSVVKLYSKVLGRRRHHADRCCVQGAAYQDVSP
jgi:glycosyltransferase involved in cell wall biosynthesis